MLDALEGLVDPSNGSYLLARDNRGDISAVSSDLLHMLFFLEPGDLASDQAATAERVSRVLETTHGYQALDPGVVPILKNQYHGDHVWPFEQAIIHSGARKFGLEGAQEVSARVIQYLDTNPEILIPQGRGFVKGGPDPQLWTIAAKNYFRRMGKT